MVSCAGSSSRSLTTTLAPSRDEAQRDLAPDAAPRSGDDGDLAVELPHVDSSVVVASCARFAAGYAMTALAVKDAAPLPPLRAPRLTREER